MEFHKVDLEKVKEIGNSWLKPLLFIGEKPEHRFEGYEGIRVKLLDDEISEGYYHIIDKMARIQLATWIIDEEHWNEVKPEEKLLAVEKALKERAGTVLLESITLTYSLDGVTRALTAEINRHRAMGFGEQSQRITDARKHTIRIPPDIKKSRFESEYCQIANDIKNLYIRMIEKGVPIEQARNIMPIGLTTHEVETGNLRGWLDIWFARIQEDAMDEHQILTGLEISAFRHRFPMLYDILLRTGRIPDPKKFRQLDYIINNYGLDNNGMYYLPK